jgi:DNA-binding response OmpR family regulator
MRREQRVLIIDDNRPLTEAVSLALGLQGFETRVAHDGLAALEVAAAFRPGSALVDLMLPLLDGWEVAARLRTLPVFGSPRLVAWTAQCDPRHRAAAFDVGFDAFLVKPASFEDMRAALLGRRARRSPSVHEPW